MLITAIVNKCFILLSSFVLQKTKYNTNSIFFKILKRLTKYDRFKANYN